MTFSLLARKPYQGGPDFDRISTFFFDLEGTVLEIAQPASAEKEKLMPRSVNILYRTASWYEKNCKGTSFDAAAHLHTAIWYYFPNNLRRMLNLAAMGTNDAIGILSFGAHIKKLKGGKRLDLSSPSSLGDYIKWDYEDYYEAPTPGEYARGWNHEIRAAQNQLLAEKGESYRDQYNAALASDLMPMPDKLEAVAIGGAQWISYVLNRGWSRSARYYCLALSEDYFLQIHIQRVFHLSEKNRDLLTPDMQRTADWLLQHIKITRPSGASAPLGLPPS